MTAGRLVSVIKAAGGAGATMVAANLAARLARGGAWPNRSGRSTALLDLDLQFGDAHLALDLAPKASLLDLLRAPDRLAPRLLPGALTDHPSGVRLLARPAGVLPLEAVSAAFADRLADAAQAAFERTIVELPSIWTDWTLQLLRRSDRVVLVSTATAAGALGARRALEALDRAGVGRPVFFVLNRLNGVAEMVERAPRLARTLHLAMGAALPFEPAAAQAADSGRLVVEAWPHTRLAKALHNAAARLDQQLEGAPGILVRLDSVA
jgi:Flp pilus assembly CpaE family ATPase